MLNSVLGKTLFEKRWMIFWWFLASFIGSLMLVQLFPTMQEMFATDIMNDIPPALQDTIDMEALQTIEGYVASQIFGQMSLVVVIFAIVFGVAAITGEEKFGTLLTQLARPIKRHHFFLQKFAALLISTSVIVAGCIAGTFLGSVIISETISLSYLWQPLVATALFATTFGAISMMFGGLGIKGGGLITGFYAVVGFALVSIGMMNDAVEPLTYVTPFGFYDPQTLITSGLEFSSTLWLISFIVIPTLIGVIIFTKRDLHT